ncbi:MAG: hypothetical protein J4F37_01140 [Acidobacteria bacterium]|nr:hypothetical protein [Acidobacteriota bacterium]
MPHRVVDADLHDAMLVAIGETERALADALPAVADLAAQAGPDVDAAVRRRVTESLTRLEKAMQGLVSSAARFTS